MFYLYDFLISKFKKKWKLAKNKINIYRDKTVCFSGKKIQIKI